MRKEKKTLKSMGIKRTTVNWHGVKVWAYLYKGKFYRTKSLAIKAYLKGGK